MGWYTYEPPLISETVAKLFVWKRRKGYFASTPCKKLGLMMRNVEDVSEEKRERFHQETRKMERRWNVQSIARFQRPMKGKVAQEKKLKKKEKKS